MNTGDAGPRLSHRTTRWLVATMVVVAVALRLIGLGEGALFIDEGESAVNALTILEHGYPTDRYLGLPLFENTLTEPWPESDEYEFRDTSYSSRGVATYHGWLPLYAIAASLALHGIEPDVASDPPRVLHDDAEIHTRILAARLPSVFFGALFVLAMFLAGRELFDAETGLTAMLVAALAPQAIWLSQQARYYSAALALATLAAWSAWRTYRHGRWSDFLSCALVFVLLFHTSSLSFTILAIASLPLLGGMLRHRHGGAKLAACTAIVALGLVPWMLCTGYFENLGRIPMARSYLRFPSEYLLYLRGREVEVGLGIVVLAATCGLVLARERLQPRVAAPLLAAIRPLLFLVGWIVAAYFGFQALVPAASCSMTRLSHQLIAGPILAGSVVLVALRRGMFPRAWPLTAPVAALALLALDGGVFHRQRRNPYESVAVFELVERLRSSEIAAGTKIYALPYQHFCLSYYTGLPVQSIAPVRREFLDDHPGELLILETIHRQPPPRVDDLFRTARMAGVELGEVEAESLVSIVHRARTHAEVEPLVRELRPQPPSLPEWTGALLVEPLLEHGVERGAFDYSLDNPVMFQGRLPLALDEFWPNFFYRFVGPEGRSGSKVNYASRMREADAEMLRSTWLVVRCPARAQGSEMRRSTYSGSSSASTFPLPSRSQRP